jgi:hypothetical protein
MSLDSYIQKRHGKNGYLKILTALRNRTLGGPTFGEWTLYCTYLLDVLEVRPPMREMGAGFLTQLHDEAALDRYRFDSDVAHFAHKAFDAKRIINKVLTLESFKSIGNEFLS